MKVFFSRISQLNLFKHTLIADHTKANQKCKKKKFKILEQVIKRIGVRECDIS